MGGTGRDGEWAGLQPLASTELHPWPLVMLVAGLSGNYLLVTQGGSA